MSSPIFQEETVILDEMKDSKVRQGEIPRLRFRMTGLVILLMMVTLGACSRLESLFVDEPVAAGIDSPDKDVAEYLQAMLQSAQAMTKSGLVRGRLGMAYDVNGLRDEAIVTYEQAEILDPDDFRWPYFRALLIAETGALEQAIKTLERALTIDPDYAPAWLWRGAWLLEAGLLDEAMIAFQQAFDLEAGSVATFGQAQVLVAQGQHQQAAEILESLVRTTNHPYIYRTLGETLRALGRTEEAHIAMAHGKDVLPLRWTDDRRDQRNNHIRGSASYNHAKHLSASGRIDEALTILERLQGHHPEEECGSEQEFFLACNLVNSMSIAYDREGLPGQALETVQRGLAINPEFIPFHLTIANLYRQQRDLESALDHLDRAIELNPARGYAHEQRGRILFGMQRFEEARAAFETALRYEPEKRTNLFYLGLAEVELGHWTQAVEHFERVVKLEPDFALGYVFLARSLGEVGRIDDARQAQNEARRHGANPAELRVTELKLRELEEK